MLFWDSGAVNNSGNGGDDTVWYHLARKIDCGTWLLPEKTSRRGACEDGSGGCSSCY